MDFTLPIDEPPLALTAVYKDRKGNVTPAPAGSVLTWTDSNPATASLDTSSSPVLLAPVSSNPGDTTVITVSDGVLPAPAFATCTLTPGKPASLDIQPAPLT